VNQILGIEVADLGLKAVAEGLVELRAAFVAGEMRHLVI
jgi:hypothetical protein